MKKIQVLALGILFLWGCDKGQDSVAPSGNSTSSNSTSNGSVANGGNGSSTAGGSGSNTGSSPSSTSAGISVWHWGSDSNPFGINNVIGDPIKVNEMVAQYKKYGVNRIYGGYSLMPGYWKDKVAAWNKRLKKEKIASSYLIGNAQWIYPENRAAMLKHITDYYINFNKSVDDSSKMQGLHVDIEPQQLAEWSSSSLSRKRELMVMLKETYKDIKNLLTSSGIAETNLSADIPVWFDNVSSVGWTSEADRNAWFLEVGKFVGSFTLMAYEVKSVDVIIDRTTWERTNFASTEVGLDIGDLGTIWSSKDELMGALSSIRTRTKQPVALHNFADFLKS